MKAINIISANYKGNFLLELIFNDNKKTVVDFNEFFKKHHHPQYNKYKKEGNFLKYKIENGNVVWGKDWDMIFPVWNLYNGRVE
jgi:hypothetical protein